ncbi:hypothetical protein EC957_001856 [Mortierella hygrophila]|uniref:Crinkler effector protein N-terminal domain-containing protein n=1 Tax=Mortierella hygrophila TaxID=979708 RepID=A0A9P6K1Z6_9FUNG|nr:hypothetical protein EC957_001856 [Mortierella hygrophila]
MAEDLTLLCLIDGQSTSDVFSVEINPKKTVDGLKTFIRNKNLNKFRNVDANELTLWQVSIPDIDDDETPLSSTRKRHRPLTLTDAIEDAGLAEIAMVDDGFSLSRLDNKQRVVLLDFLGQKVNRSETFHSISNTAQEWRRAFIEDKGKLLAPPGTKLPVALSTTVQPLQDTKKEDDTKKKDTTTLSAPSGTKLPIVGTNSLYVREIYKVLHDTILSKFEGKRTCTGDEVPNHVAVAGTSRIGESAKNERTRTGDEPPKQIVVTGTSGIGKSAFLVYFAIRLLAESDDDNPPIIIFHTKLSEKCYVFGGRSTVRSGNIDVFRPFLNLHDTWYFVDSSPYPVLNQAKTVIAYSSKTLYSEAPEFKYVDIEVAWRYYMPPWSLEELEACRTSVEGYSMVSFELMDELYSKIGGMPRYVLERPMKELNHRPRDLDGAKTKALYRLEQTLKTVDSSITLLQQLFPQGKDDLDSSDSLVHRWPTDDHRTARLEWASAYVAEKIIGSLTRDAWDDVMKNLIGVSDGGASGILFKAYVLRAFREGGHTFELKDLETGESARLEIPQNPKIVHFDKITQTLPGTLFIPKVCNYACVHLLLAPRDLFQITVSENRPIKGLPLKNLITSLREASWIPPDDLRLIFVVPSCVYANFKKQNYLDSDGRVYVKVPQEFQHVKQYALKIDMESAVAGRSLGLQTPLQ